MEEIGSLLVMQFMSGLTRAMVLFVVASGITLIFGTLNIPNFAHGSLYMVGAFICYEFWNALMGTGTGLLISVVLATIAIAIIGLLIEAVLLRPIYARGHTPQLLLTFGLTLITFDVVRLIWGSRFYSISAPEILSGSVPIFGVPFPIYNIFVILFGFATYGGLYLLIYKTKLGHIVRAAVFNRDMVAALGIPIPRLFSLVFLIGAGLAGLGAGVAAPLGTIGVGMDTAILIDCFAVIIVGGVGNVTGTLLGSLIVGMTYAYGILVLPKVALAFMFVILALVLILRPRGLLGKPK